MKSVSELEYFQSGDKKMANLGSYLATNQYLSTNDYLVSPSGFFYCFNQGDGNLVVYRGNDPNNAGTSLWASGNVQTPGNFCTVIRNNGQLETYAGATPPAPGAANPLWTSQKTSNVGNYCLAMQDDGNLVIYPYFGISPESHSTDAFWATNKWDPVSSVSLGDITYDLPNGNINPPEQLEVFNQEVPNSSTVEQQTSLGSSEALTQTSGWSDSLQAGIKVTAEGQVGIPFVANGKLQVSINVKNTYVWNGSTTTSTEWNWQANVVTPPQTTVTVSVLITQTTIVVPYQQAVSILYQSGATYTGFISGSYTGKSMDDATISYSQPASIAAEAAASADNS
jgi:hypothetical protein